MLSMCLHHKIYGSRQTFLDLFFSLYIGNPSSIIFICLFMSFSITVFSTFSLYVIQYYNVFNILFSTLPHVYFIFIFLLFKYISFSVLFFISAVVSHGTKINEDLCKMVPRLIILLLFYSSIRILDFYFIQY
jgi:hypothetical protein